MTNDDRQKATGPGAPDWARFDELLPDYVGQRLSDQDRAWVAGFAARSPRAAAELEIERRILEGFDARVRQLPSDIGLRTLMARVRADARPAAVSAVPAARPGRWLDALGRLFSGPRLSLALGVVVLVQAGFLVHHMPPESPAPTPTAYRSMERDVGSVHVRMLVASGVSEESLRHALREAGARIVWGPDQLGEYWLRSDKLSPQALAIRLEQQRIAATAVIDRVGPPREAR
ncbi:MAG: hypothetical protein R3E48_16290 [Burkholderiaceae bacterium]